MTERLPAGPHRGLDGLDPAPGLPDVSIEVSITFSKAGAYADFTGTSPQIAAPINCVRSGPLSAVLYALLCLAAPGTFRNGGLLRAISLVLPEGSVINARPPAAVNARMGLVRATTSAVLQAVAQAVPGRMPAANSGMSYVLAFSGQLPDGGSFVSTEIIAGGAGGGPFSDGADGISTDVGNAMNMPVEALEEIAPIRVLRAVIRTESGGAGAFRGWTRHSPRIRGARRQHLRLPARRTVHARARRTLGRRRTEAGACSDRPRRWQRDRTQSPVCLPA